MKALAAVVAALLGILGLIFVVGSQGQVARIVVGAVLMVAAGAVIALAKMQPTQVSTTVVHQVDLSGDVKLETLSCNKCGGTLDEKSVEVRAGAPFVNCSYCGAAYQLEEAPKW